MVNLYLSCVLTVCYPLEVECGTWNARRAIPMLGRVFNVLLVLVFVLLLLLLLLSLLISGLDRPIVQGITQ